MFTNKSNFMIEIFIFYFTFYLRTLHIVVAMVIIYLIIKSHKLALLYNILNTNITHKLNRCTYSVLKIFKFNFFKCLLFGVLQLITK